MNTNSRSWCTVQEAAIFLGVSPTTVKRRIKDGSLEGRKEGNRYLVNRSSLERFRAQMNATRTFNGVQTYLKAELKLIKEEKESLQEQVRELEIEKVRYEAELSSLREQNQLFKERIRELEADKAFLLKQIEEKDRLINELTPRALPKPRTSFTRKIKQLFKHSKEV